MNYVELTGQESGIWIYKGDKEALICNWSADNCEDCRPIIFGFGWDLIWMPIDEDDEEKEWVKTHEDIQLDDWMDCVTVIYDPNNDANKEYWFNVTGDVYEYGGPSGDYVILAPKGWN